MRGYPKGHLTKQDFENLLEMREHADRAKSDLAKLAAIDDGKIIVDQGSEAAPQLVEIDNPLPAWKRAGFAGKAELASVAAVDVEPTEEVAGKV